MNEFEEIAHTGGKLEFIVSEKGVSTRFSQKSPWAFSAYQIAASPDGELYDTIPMAGVGRARERKPEIPVMLLSDREGLFGRLCPNCETYFRTSGGRQYQFCPYCGRQAHNLEFLTSNQKEYIECYLEAFLEAHDSREDRTVELDQIVDELGENRPRWIYSEERQQTRHTCTECQDTYDILGEYGYCPSCGRGNHREVFLGKLEQAKLEFAEKDAALDDRSDREVEWEKLTRCVSDFEALANELKGRLLRLPNTLGGAANWRS